MFVAARSRIRSAPTTLTGVGASKPPRTMREPVTTTFSSVELSLCAAGVADCNTGAGCAFEFACAHAGFAAPSEAHKANAAMVAQSEHFLTVHPRAMADVSLVMFPLGLRRIVVAES